MKIRVEKQFVDYGCGFPVVLFDVPMVHVRGVWTPNIDYNKLHEDTFQSLINKTKPLTAAQNEFVRHFRAMIDHSA